ncbi:Cellulose synthase [Sesbania bispinosa]|nr:Cellulose synthase [Sesbania bispinosa]
MGRNYQGLCMFHGKYVPAINTTKKPGAMNALITMKCLDGIQGPVYVGTGCVFNRQALYVYEPPLSKKRPKKSGCCWPLCCCCSCGGDSQLTFDLEEIDEEWLDGYEEQEESSFMSKKKFEKRFGQSPVFIASTLMEGGGLPKGINS